MLESVRQNSRSAIVYILFGIIIVAFIVSFGPGSMSGGDSSFSLGGRYAARVNGAEISELDFTFAFMASGGGQDREDLSGRDQQRRQTIMDGLIERELLCQIATRMGLQVSEEEVAEALYQPGRSNMLVLGEPTPIHGSAYKAIDGHPDVRILDRSKLRLVLQGYYRVNEKQFVEIQRRELLADKVRQIVRLSMRAGLDEAKADFEDRGRQLNLEFVRFGSYRFAQDLIATETDIENYARAHEDELKKTYEERKSLYTKQEKSAHVHRILVELKKDASPEAVTAAQARIDAALATIQSGTKFSDVARTTSDDQSSKNRGGDLGWRRKDSLDFGPDLSSKVFAAKGGDLLGPARSERGFELIKIDGFREGDISLGQARAELAEELYRSATAKDLAQKGAQEAAAKAKAGEKLAVLFPKSDPAATPGAAPANKIQVEETGLHSRRKDVVPGIGPSEDLVKKVWKLKPGESLGPVAIGDSWVVVVLKERQEPDLADFEKRKAEIVSDYARVKWSVFKSELTHDACVSALSNGKLRVNNDLLTSPGAAAGPLAALLGNRKYEPCKSM